jgi:hypothetical protein
VLRDDDGVSLLFDLSDVEASRWIELTFAVVLAFGSVEAALRSNRLRLGPQAERDLRSQLPASMGGHLRSVAGMHGLRRIETAIQRAFGKWFVDDLRRRLGLSQGRANE